MTPILLLDALLAIPFALLVAYLRGSLTDRTIMIATTVALSVSFLVYVIVGQYVFAFRLGWFPVQGWSDSLLTNLAVFVPLPVMLAVMVGIAPQTRLYRTFFLDEIGQDYVRTARAKGLTEPRILLTHVMRNATIPILTNLAVALPGIFVGSFLIEVFFSIPGLGREVLLAVNRSDYPVIQAVTIYLAVITMVVNLATDVLYKLSTRGRSDERTARPLRGSAPHAGGTGRRPEGAPCAQSGRRRQRTGARRSVPRALARRWRRFSSNGRIWALSAGRFGLSSSGGGRPGARDCRPTRPAKRRRPRRGPQPKVAAAAPSGRCIRRSTRSRRATRNGKKRRKSTRPRKPSRPRRCPSAATGSAATSSPRRSRARRSRSWSVCSPRWSRR